MNNYRERLLGYEQSQHWSVKGSIRHWNRGFLFLLDRPFMRRLSMNYVRSLNTLQKVIEDFLCVA